MAKWPWPLIEAPNAMTVAVLAGAATAEVDGYGKCSRTFFTVRKESLWQRRKKWMLHDLVTAVESVSSSLSLGRARFYCSAFVRATFTHV